MGRDMGCSKLPMMSLDVKSPTHLMWLESAHLAWECLVQRNRKSLPIFPHNARRSRASCSHSEGKVSTDA